MFMGNKIRSNKRECDVMLKVIIILMIFYFVEKCTIVNNVVQSHYYCIVNTINMMI